MAGLYWIVVVLAVAAAAYFWFFYLDHRTPVQIMDEEDGGDPVKRWARGAYTMLNGKFDPGLEGAASADAARGALRRDWSVTDAASARQRLSELAEVPSGDAAWDHVRRIVLARMAAGAAFVPQGESWAAVAASRDALRKAYPSWEAMHAAYRDRLVGSPQGQGERVEQFDFNVQQVSRPLWTAVAY